MDVCGQVNCNAYWFLELVNFFNQFYDDRGKSLFFVVYLNNKQGEFIFTFTVIYHLFSTFHFVWNNWKQLEFLLFIHNATLHILHIIVVRCGFALVLHKAHLLDVHLIGMWGRFFNLIASGTCGFRFICGLADDLSGKCTTSVCHDISNAESIVSGDDSKQLWVSVLKNCSSVNLVSWFGMKLWSPFIKKAEIQKILFKYAKLNLSNKIVFYKIILQLYGAFKKIIIIFFF